MQGEGGAGRYRDQSLIIMHFRVARKSQVDYLRPKLQEYGPLEQP